MRGCVRLRGLFTRAGAGTSSRPGESAKGGKRALISLKSLIWAPAPAAFINNNAMREKRGVRESLVLKTTEKGARYSQEGENNKKF